MLNWLPAPLHRTLYRAAHWARVRVWRLWKPATSGVRVLALDPQGRVLLIRHSYGSRKWMPPGGGMGRGEDPLIAAGRELLEETGLALRDAHLAENENESIHGAPHRVNIAIGHVEGEPRPDGREIVEAAFFPLDALPGFMPPGLADRIRATLQHGTER